MKDETTHRPGSKFPRTGPHDGEAPLVVELDARDVAVEAIDEARAQGFRPALVAFLDDDGDTRLYAIGVDHGSFLSHLLQTYGRGTPEPELGN